MKAKLRVVCGELRDRHGDDAGREIEVRTPRFVVGTSRGCQLRCRSKLISPRHCELRLSETGLCVRDLDSRSGTFVNDRPTLGNTNLAQGDRLRVGRLEFEIDLVLENQACRPADDPMADYVSNLLGEADAEDRARRMDNPLARQFQVEASKAEPASTDETDSVVQPIPPRPPRKKPPGRLPPPPKYVADDTVQAAQETLQKLIERTRKPG